MDARQQRSRLCHGLGHGQLHLAELTRSVVQVELIEHGVLPVAGQRGPVLCTEAPALLKEPAQVGHVGNLLGREHFLSVKIFYFFYTFYSI